MYALFDWDNTLRRGLTIFDFAGYLHDKGVLPPYTLAAMEVVRASYAKGEIDHDELARVVPEYFALGHTGLDAAAIDAACADYRESRDHATIFPFTPVVFDYCKQNGIETIVVSGAPAIVVRTYRDAFGIDDILAFDSEVVDGVYTGRVACNYGSIKREAVRDLIARKGETPLFGMGDSGSDIALLDNSLVKLSVGPNTDWVADKINHYQCRQDEDGRAMVEFIDRHRRA